MYKVEITYKSGGSTYMDVEKLPLISREDSLMLANDNQVLFINLTEVRQILFDKVGENEKFI